jgi:hypothetical protein
LDSAERAEHCEPAPETADPSNSTFASVTRLPGIAKVRSGNQMDDGGLSAALDRAERAIERVQKALSSPGPATSGRDDELRAKVREVVEELDELIREAAV